MYHKLRENPKWYLRKELVKDCIQRLGCCEKRHSKFKTVKGIGHCTVDCGCCTRNRGYEFTGEGKKKMAEKTESSLRNENPFFLLTMIEAFFSEPQIAEVVATSPITPRKQSRRQSRWRRLGKKCIEIFGGTIKTC